MYIGLTAYYPFNTQVQICCYLGIIFVSYVGLSVFYPTVEGGLYYFSVFSSVSPKCISLPSITPFPTTLPATAEWPWCSPGHSCDDGGH